MLKSAEINNDNYFIAIKLFAITVNISMIIVEDNTKCFIKQFYFDIYLSVYNMGKC